MASDIANQQVCAALKAHRIPIDLGTGHGGLIDPKESRFDQECQKLFDEGIQYQKNSLRIQPRPWTAPLIADIASYAKKHGMKVRFSRFELNAASYHNGEIKIAVNGPAPSPTKLAHYLDHEFGHQCDGKLVNFFYPGVRKLLDSDGNIGKQEMVVAEAYFGLIKARLSEQERVGFDSRAQDFFVGNKKGLWDDEVAEIVNVSAELLRDGEEIYDERLREVYLDSEIPLSFKKDNRMRPADYQRLAEEKAKRASGYLRNVVMIAELQETGLWEEFKKRSDFDPKIAAILDERHIQFARLCIRAATRYYPMVGLPR